MTVIFPGGVFLILFKNLIKNKFLAGNIPVIKSPLSFFLGVGGREEGGREEEGGGEVGTFRAIRWQLL